MSINHMSVTLSELLSSDTDLPSIYIPLLLFFCGFFWVGGKGGNASYTVTIPLLLLPTPRPTPTFSIESLPLYPILSAS